MAVLDNNKKLGVVSLIMITVVSVDSIRNLPAGALFGSTLIFFYLLGIFCFFIPSAMVSADLAARYPSRSGIYIWVKDALGQKMGLMAIWLQWIENVIWYPAILSFAASTMTYIVSPKLADNAEYISGITITVFWLLTWLNCRGIMVLSRFSTFCTICGLFLPMMMIIVMGIAWIVTNQPMAISFSFDALLPHFESNTWVSLTAVMLSLTGIEVATVHASDVDNPNIVFPKVLFWSTIIIACTLLLGSLSIAIVVPSQQISLVAGIMQTVDKLFSYYHIRFLLLPFALMLILGVLGSVSNWIIAPTRGLYNAACEGHFPTFMQKVNARGAPASLLICQAWIVTGLTLLFVVFPHVNDFYWILTVSAAQLYMLMYILMFIACMILHTKRETGANLFSIPGGKIGIRVVCIMGILAALVTLCVGFIPPNDMDFTSGYVFAAMISTSMVFFCLLPWLYIKYRKS